MAKYMIHTMPKRVWYVKKYLIPSMLLQGISNDDILVYNDIEREGNLKACMSAFAQVDTSAEGTWHLQDDVIICHDFKEMTEKYDSGIVCAFKSIYDGELMPGRMGVKEMWFSFPCIRIPNDIAIKCSKWVLTYMIGNPIYKNWWEQGVNDDLLFRQFVWENYPNRTVLNLNPNLVDHIDYLIGGTVNSNSRITEIRARYFKDEYLVDELKEKLRGQSDVENLME